MKMKKILPDEYNFAPNTYCLPDDEKVWIEDYDNI